MPAACSGRARRGSDPCIDTPVGRTYRLAVEMGIGRPARDASDAREGVLDFPCSVQRLENGNTLIADAGDELGEGSEILEVNAAGEVMWRYAAGLAFAHSAERLPDGATLITDTGNHRLLVAEQDGTVRLDSSQWGSLSDGSQLAYPNDAHQLDDGTFLVTDRNSDRLVIVDAGGRVRWSLRSPAIHHPHNADRQPNGNILVAASGSNRVLELDPAGAVVWSYGDGSEELLNFPRDADRVEDHRVLITDSRHHRVLEVSPLGEVEWQFAVDYYASFYEADRLPNGNVLIADQHHHRVIEVDRSGRIVWSFCNHRPRVPTVPRLVNGGLAESDAAGVPAGWYVYCRFAEGAGTFVRGADGAPGLANGGSGALFLAQRVAVEPGRRYTLSGALRAEGLTETASAHLQLYFLDAEWGALSSAPDAPRSTRLSGTVNWRVDEVTATAPDAARSVEVRVFVGGGPGRVFARDLRLREE